MMKLEDVILLKNLVWAVKTLLNKIIVCTCSDGFCYIFTNDKCRRCDEETEKKYIGNLWEAQNQLANGISPVDMPDISLLKEGDVALGNGTIVRDGGRLCVMTWSKGYKRMMCIGGYDISGKNAEDDHRD